jgi:hypothetical protein
MFCALLAAFVLYMIRWKSPIDSHGIILARTGEQLKTECHCQVAEFLLHKYKRMIKSKLTASITLSNSAE